VQESGAQRECSGFPVREIIAHGLRMVRLLGIFRIGYPRGEELQILHEVSLSLWLHVWGGTPSTLTENGD
jgi:hypothetical protein